MSFSSFSFASRQPPVQNVNKFSLSKLRSDFKNLNHKLVALCAIVVILFPLYPLLTIIVLLASYSAYKYFEEIVSPFVSKAQVKAELLDMQIQNSMAVSNAAFGAITDASNSIESVSKAIVPYIPKASQAPVASFGKMLTSFSLSLYSFFRADATSRVAILANFVISNDLLSQIPNAVKTFNTAVLPFLNRLSKALAGVAVAQSADSVPVDKNMFRALSDLFANALGFSKEELDRKDVDKLKNFHTGYVVIRDIQSCVASVIDLLKQVVYDLYFRYTGRPYHSSETQQLVDSALDWLTRVDNVDVRDSTIELRGDPDLAREIQDLKSDAEQIAKDLLANSLTRVNFSPFWVKYNLIKNLNELCMQHRRSAKQRIPPVIIHLVGGPNNGKSAMIQLLVASVMKAMGLPLQKNNTYSRACNTDYWDGYLNQFATVMDDFLQFKDDDRWAEHLLSIVEMGNIAPMPLNMAKVQEKGAVYFDSRLVILTSNDAKVDNTPKIQSVEAFKGRQDFLIEVVIPDRFKQTNSNNSRSKVVIPEGACAEDLYSLTPLDVMTNRPMVGDPWSFYDLVEKVVECAKSKENILSQNHFDRINKLGANDFKEYMAERKHVYNTLHHSVRLDPQFAAPPTLPVPDDDVSPPNEIPQYMTVQGGTWVFPPEYCHDSLFVKSIKTDSQSPRQLLSRMTDMVHRPPRKRAESEFNHMVVTGEVPAESRVTNVTKLFNKHANAYRDCIRAGSHFLNADGSMTPLDAIKFRDAFAHLPNGDIRIVTPAHFVPNSPHAPTESIEPFTPDAPMPTTSLFRAEAGEGTPLHLEGDWIFRKTTYENMVTFYDNRGDNQKSVDEDVNDFVSRVWDVDEPRALPKTMAKALVQRSIVCTSFFTTQSVFVSVDDEVVTQVNPRMLALKELAPAAPLTISENFMVEGSFACCRFCSYTVPLSLRGAMSYAMHVCPDPTVTLRVSDLLDEIPQDLEGFSEVRVVPLHFYQFMRAYRTIERERFRENDDLSPESYLARVKPLRELLNWFMHRCEYLETHPFDGNQARIALIRHKLLGLIDPSRDWKKEYMRAAAAIVKARMAVFQHNFNVRNGVIVGACALAGTATAFVAAYGAMMTALKADTYHQVFKHTRDSDSLMDKVKDYAYGATRPMSFFRDRVARIGEMVTAAENGGERAKAWLEKRKDKLIHEASYLDEDLADRLQTVLSKTKAQAANYNVPRRAVPSRVRMRVPVKRPTPMVTKAQMNSQQLNTMVSHILPSSIQPVRVRDLTLRYDFTVNLLMVCERIGLGPAHLFNRFNKDNDVTLEFKRLGFTFQKSAVSVVEIDGMDLVVVTILENSLPQFKDIRKFFVPEEKLKQHYSTGVSMIRLDPESFVPQVLTTTNAVLVPEAKVEDDFDNLMVITQALQCANMPTRAGDCGSPYTDGNFILGIHSAGGYNNISVCTTITREYLDQLLSLAQAQMLSETMPIHECIPEGADDPNVYLNPSDGSLYPTIYPTSEIRQTMEECFLVKPFDLQDLLAAKQYEHLQWIGTVPDRLTHRLPGKTNIAKSLVHGLISEPTTAPAALKPVNGVSPLENSIAKLNRRRPFLTRQAYEVVMKVTQHMLEEDRGKLQTPLKRLTIAEACQTGSKEYPMESLNLNTSPGWPHTIKKLEENVRSKGKHYLFDEEGLPTPELGYDLMVFCNAISNDWWYPIVYSQNLKDERRPIEKVKACKTRAISCGPIELLILKRMFFGDLVSHTKHNYHLFESKVGINPHSTDWTTFVNQMLEFDPNAKELPGDFGAYDGSRLYQVSAIILHEYTLKMYDDGDEIVDHDFFDQKNLPTNSTVRRNLAEYTLAPVYIVSNQIYRAFGTMPSGDFMTTWDNCKYNTVVTRSVFAISRMRACLLWSPHDYSANVLSANFGDDNKHRTKQAALSYFNMNSLEELYLEIFNMEYTDANKHKISVPFYELEDTTFLKRGFRRQGNIWFAPLEKEVIYEMMNWVTKTMPIEEATRINCEVAVREAFHHGEEFFNKLKAEVNDALYKAHLKPIIATYEQYLFNYTNGIFSTETDVLPLTGQSGKEEIPQDSDRQEDQAVTNEVIEIAAFSDTIAHVEEIAKFPTNVHDASDPYADQGLVPVLSRVYTTNVSWKSTHAVGALLKTFKFPRDHISGHLNIRDKLSHFSFFRSNVKIAVRVNSTRFHYGKLLITWLPFVTLNTGAFANSSPFTELVNTSNNPHVIVSAGSPQTVEFVIPYLAPYEWMRTDRLTTTQNYFIGTVEVRVMNPLLASGGTTTPDVPVSFMINFDNPQVAGPSYSAMAASDEPIFRAQSGRHPLKKEQEQVSSGGLISGTLSTVAKVSAMLKSAPYIGGVASVVSPAAGIASAIASTLGYDKPTSVVAPTVVQPRYVDALSHATGLDQSEKLSMDPTNAISVDPAVFGTNEDEMLFSTFYRKPGLIATYVIDSTATPDSIVASFPVAPWFTYVHSYNVGSLAFKAAVNHRTSFLSSLFCYWRGSMKYHFEVVTSQFVSGRLRVTHLPLSGDEYKTGYGAGDTISKTIDFGGDTNFDFSVPYCQPRVVQRALNPIMSQEYLPNSPTLDDYSNGTLYLNLTNPLSFTGESQNVKVYINVWVSAGEDMRFYGPRSKPNLYAAPVGSEQVFKAQMGSTPIPPEPSKWKLFEKTFEPLIPATLYMKSGTFNGEEIDSLRTYIHRYTSIGQIESSTENVLQLVHSPGIQVYTPGMTNYNWLDLIMSAFLFWRGSFRYKLVNMEPIGTSDKLYAVSACNLSQTPSPDPLMDEWPTIGSNTGGSYAKVSGFGMTLARAKTRDVVEFELPYYSPLPFNRMKFPGVSEAYTPDRWVPVVQTNGGPSKFQVFAAAGDDLSLGFSIAPPVYVIRTTTGEAEWQSARENDILLCQSKQQSRLGSSDRARRKTVSSSDRSTSPVTLGEDYFVDLGKIEDVSFNNPPADSKVYRRSRQE